MTRARGHADEPQPIAQTYSELFASASELLCHNLRQRLFPVQRRRARARYSRVNVKDGRSGPTYTCRDVSVPVSGSKQQLNSPIENPHGYYVLSYVFAGFEIGMRKACELLLGRISGKLWREDVRRSRRRSS